jgi:hypothetical protein
MWVVRNQVWPVDETRQTDKFHQVRLHWLLPDGKWELHETTLHLDFGQGEITLKVVGPEAGLTPSLARAGEIVSGSGPNNPVRGWVSPTYGVKHPALSFSVTAHTKLPITVTTTWQLPG